jgi:hypothetical protein
LQDSAQSRPKLRLPEATDRSILGIVENGEQGANIKIVSILRPQILRSLMFPPLGKASTFALFSAITLGLVSMARRKFLCHTWEKGPTQILDPLFTDARKASVFIYATFCMLILSNEYAVLVLIDSALVSVPKDRH